MKQIKQFLCAALCAVMLLGSVVPVWAAADFDDVAGHWAIEEIRWARENGVVDGVGNNKFEPEREVANCEMIQMVINSFFKSDYDAYEAKNYDEMQEYFGGNTYWFSFKAYYAFMNGLLSNTIITINDYDSCYKPMTRYDMAQMLTNTAKVKGIEATEAQKASAQSSITDYASIPTYNQDAVKNCFALGLLNGKNGAFAGSDNMTRAEACAVIRRMDGLLSGGTAADPGPSETPAQPAAPTVKDIAVTTKANATATNGSYGSTSGTAYTITDNGFATGCLNNGKEINEANIAELLETAKTIWPTDTSWTDSGANNHWYQSAGSVVTGALSKTATGATQNISANYGCGGFAAMVSDYLFGKNNNPYHRVTNFEDIRPGDIVVMMDNNKNARHVVIVTGINQTGSRAGYVFVAEGNLGDVIHWPGTSSWDAAGPEDLAAYGSYVIFSRWPASAVTQPTTPTTPAAPTVKDIQVTSRSITNGTAWIVKNNGFSAGYLNNGKPITEENVKELLEKAKTVWPTGMTWGPSGTPNNNSYGGIDGAVRDGITPPPGVGGNFECSAFAGMLSAYLFGQSNPWHVVSNFADIHPGDIIVSKSLNHTMVVIDKVKTGEYAGMVFVAEGNIGKQVNWTDTTLNPKWYALDPEYFGTFTVYSYYPN